MCVVACLLVRPPSCCITPTAPLCVVCCVVCLVVWLLLWCWCCCCCEGLRSLPHARSHHHSLKNFGSLVDDGYSTVRPSRTTTTAAFVVHPPDESRVVDVAQAIQLRHPVIACQRCRAVGHVVRHHIAAHRPLAVAVICVGQRLVVVVVVVVGFIGIAVVDLASGLVGAVDSVAASKCLQGCQRGQTTDGAHLHRRERELYGLAGVSRTNGCRYRGAVVDQRVPQSVWYGLHLLSVADWCVSRRSLTVLDVLFCCCAASLHSLAPYQL
jgi:hypothetical protein